MTTIDRAKEKFSYLVNKLKQYDKIAVAYSGGVDSTLLLYAAKCALGPGRVTALTLVSVLSPTYAIDIAHKVIEENFSGEVDHRKIAATPLAWEQFVANDSKRCYYCKKRMYTLLLQAMAEGDYNVLLDGTNVDDMGEQRPGRKALLELGISTPLVNAGLLKVEIRLIARDLGLINHDLPSNSCLATRIPSGKAINYELLKKIDQAELFLVNLGFSGCRVKPQGQHTIIEVQAGDTEKIMTKVYRDKINLHFASLDFSAVALSFTER